MSVEPVYGEDGKFLGWKGRNGKLYRTKGMAICKGGIK